MPGAIDMHAHFEDPGHTEREDFTTGTMSAAAGGITTVIEHPLTYPPVTTAELYREKREMATREGGRRLRPLGRAHRSLDPRDRARSGREGAPGFKAFMPISDPSYPHVTDAEFLEGMREVKAVGGLVLVHAESDSLLQAGLARHAGRRAAATRSPTTRRGRRSSRRRRCTARSTSPRTPACGSRSCTSRARSAPSCVRRARSAAGRPATMEICPHHLLLDLDDLVRLGPYGVCAPALRDRALVERLWDSVLDGTADCLVSDHSAYTLEEKEPGWDEHLRRAARLPGDPGDGAARARRGLPPPRHVARRVRALLVHERGPHRRAVSRARARCCPAPDADLALYDLETEWTVDARTPAVLEEPVVAVRRAARAGAGGAHARARRDGVRRRRDPGRARLRAASCPARTTTRWPRQPTAAAG